MAVADFLDKLGLADQPDPELSMDAARGLADANTIASDHAIMGGEKAIDIFRYLREAGLGNIADAAGGASELGKSILTDPSLMPGEGPVTTEGDLTRYLEGATNWQQNALKDAGVDLTFGGLGGREQYGDMKSRQASAGFDGRDPLAEFGGRQQLGTYLQDRTPTSRFGGRNPLTNRLATEGPTNTRTQAGPTSRRGQDAPTERMAERDPTSRWGGHLSELEDFDPESVVLSDDTGYQFRLSEGEKAIRRRQNAGSGARTGATYKALMEHGQGLASQEYDNAYNRAMDKYRIGRENRLTERDIALQDYDVNRQNEWRDQDVSLQDFVTNRESTMRDQDMRYRTDAFNRDSEMRDQDNAFRTDAFNRDSQMRDQDNRYRQAGFNRDTDIRNQDTALQDFEVNRQSEMRDQDLDYRDASFERDTDIRNQDTALQDYLTNRDTQSRNQDTMMQDYLVNRDTEQINADRQMQDYLVNRDTFNQNADRQLQDYMTDRDTWMQNVNNVERQVDRSFQIGGWAQSVLNAQNEQFAQGQREFMANLGQFWTGVGQWGAEAANGVLMGTGMAEAGAHQGIHEAVGAGAIGSANAMAGGVNIFQGFKSQQQSMDFQILGSLIGFMQGQGWF